jgi:hypothetical protein
MSAVWVYPPPCLPDPVEHETRLLVFHVTADGPVPFLQWLAIPCAGQVHWPRRVPGQSSADTVKGLLRACGWWDDAVRLTDHGIGPEGVSVLEVSHVSWSGIALRPEGPAWWVLPFEVWNGGTCCGVPFSDDWEAWVEAHPEWASLGHPTQDAWRSPWVVYGDALPEAHARFQALFGPPAVAGEPGQPMQYPFRWTWPDETPPRHAVGRFAAFAGHESQWTWTSRPPHLYADSYEAFVGLSWSPACTPHAFLS